MSIKLKLVYLFVFSLFSVLLLSMSFFQHEALAATSTLDISGPVVLNLMPHSVNGDFGKSNDVTITASTDSSQGYTLMIQAVNSTSLMSGDNTITTLDAGTSITESAFASGNYNGKWGYKPSMLNSEANSTFRPSPSTTGDIINATSCANGTTDCPNNADIYSLTIGAKVDLSQPIGSYTNTFNIILIAVIETDYSIVYRDTLVSNMPEDISGDTDASSVAISSNVPVREGYAFLGWCAGTSSSSNITTTAGVDSCSTTVYNPNGGGTNLSLAIDQTTASNDTYLYAMWSVNSYTVTVNFAGTGISSVSFTNATYGNAATVSTSGGTTSLKHGVEYTITMNFSSGNGFDRWATTANGTLGSTSANPTTYTVTNTATLTATGKNVTVLYDTVAAMSKGTQTAADLQATIIVPTSSDPSQDTSNSGVYEYNSSIFGASSDASNDYKIYYYRGVLDSNLDGTTSYGSNGDGAYYPNYVRLGNTCWRILRTTGSGGVKMIYNGLYSSGTTANSCANAQTNAQVISQAFGLKGNSAQSDWYYNINRVGYTFNNSSDIQDITTATSVDTVFGSDANPSLNNARSNIKTYIEDTWYTRANGISAYTSILEASAGYCNDRTVYSDASTSTALTTIPPYGTSSSGQTMYFGAYGRNYNSAKTPSLTCPRSTVDLYRYVANSAGLSNELKYPVALLTADEASFAGSGSSTATNGSAYSRYSFLCSGTAFLLLSPYSRVSSNGNVLEFYLLTTGNILGIRVQDNHYGVRPVISLKSGITATSGSGTATDPWVVTAP